MRLWSYQLIPVLPNKMLVSQWRECLAIKRQWEKGTLKHRLVSYVMDCDKKLFASYTRRVMQEMYNRNIKFKADLVREMIEFAGDDPGYENYLEHNERYLKQCLYNLQEKADRGIITKEEWQKIEDKFGEYLK